MAIRARITPKSFGSISTSSDSMTKAVWIPEFLVALAVFLSENTRRQRLRNHRLLLHLRLLHDSVRYGDSVLIQILDMLQHDIQQQREYGCNRQRQNVRDPNALSR